VDLYNLTKLGDCQNLWSPLGHEELISENLRQFNEHTASVIVRDPDMCIRLNKNNCGSQDRVFDFYADSSRAKNLPGNSFSRATSSAEVIPCPARSQIIVYAGPNYTGAFRRLNAYVKS
jgi:hypothetical protein